MLGKPEDVSLGTYLFADASQKAAVDWLREANGGTSLHSPVYHLLAGDLRRPPTESLAPLLASPTEPLLSPTLPTLLIFECVLAYMSPAASSAVLQWFTDHFAVGDRKSTRLNSSHSGESRMPSSA